MQIEASEVIQRYRDELAKMTERAIIAEAQVLAFQQAFTQAQITHREELDQVRAEMGTQVQQAAEEKAEPKAPDEKASAPKRR